MVVFCESSNAIYLGLAFQEKLVRIFPFVTWYSDGRYVQLVLFPVDKIL